MNRTFALPLDLALCLKPAFHVARVNTARATEWLVNMACEEGRDLGEGRVAYPARMLRRRLLLALLGLLYERSHLSLLLRLLHQAQSLAPSISLLISVLTDSPGFKEQLMPALHLVRLSSLETVSTNSAPAVESCDHYVQGTLTRDIPKTQPTTPFKDERRKRSAHRTSSRLKIERMTKCPPRLVFNSRQYTCRCTWRANRLSQLLEPQLNSLR